MNKIVLFTAVLGCAAAAPALYYHHDTPALPVLHTVVSSPSKTTITKNSQVVNHGGHEIVHVPVHQPIHTQVHQPVYYHELEHTLVHEPVHTLVHEPVQFKEPAKSSQYFKLENKKYHVAKAISVVPVVHKVVSPVVSVVHAPVVTRSGDSAVSHQSSTTHETVHEIHSAPLYTLHH